jgi:WD40 repeat protein
MKKFIILLATAIFAINFVNAQTPVWVKQAQPDGNPCLGVSFSNDGTKIVSGSECPDARVRIWDASNGTMLYENIDTLMECYMGTAFSSNGMYFALIEETGILSVYDYMGATPQLMYNLDTETGAAYSVAFSPDNTKIVTGGDNDTVFVYNVTNGSEIMALAGHTANVLAVTYSPNGNLIGSADETGKIKIWNASTGALISTINAHNAAINAIKFSPDNVFITSCADDHMIHTFNVSTGSMTGMIHEHTSAVKQIDITSNQQYLISVSNDKTIRIFDFASGTELKVINDAVRGTQNTISIAQDNNRFVVGTGNGSVVLWKLDEVLGIKNIENNVIKATIMPNPASDYLNITIKNSDYIAQKTKISLINSNGQQVLEIYEGLIKENMTFNQDIKQFSNGNYQVCITTNNVTKTFPIIISK